MKIYFVVDEKKELDPTGKTAYNEACEKTGDIFIIKPIKTLI